MTSKQYEELCRFFLAQELNLPLDKFQSVEVQNAIKQGEAEYAHQIDVLWEVEDDVARIKMIANAKWRQAGAYVELGDLLLLQKVRDAICAHKAILITNTDFSEGTKAAAVHEGVALHVVRPEFKYGHLHPNHVATIRSELQKLAKRAGAPPLYTHAVIHKGLGLGRTPADAAPAEATAPGLPAGILIHQLVQAARPGDPLAYRQKTFSGVNAPTADQQQPKSPKPAGLNILKK